ncbi:MAG: pentapeptide repeat-containing protein, partial [Caulobacteraceae bacterium]
MTRTFLAALALLASASATPVLAGGDKDVPRQTSIGGSCPGCVLTGKKLTNATFMGGDFTKA